MRKNDAYEVVFSRRALQDLIEARSWYNLQQKGLVKRLISDAKSILPFIKHNPFRFSKI